MITMLRSAGLITMLLLVVNACSEAPLRRLFPGSPVSAQPLRVEPVDSSKFALCPRPAGSYENENSVGGYPLELLFKVQIAGTSRGEHFDREAAEGNALDILGPVKDGIRRPYQGRDYKNIGYVVSVRPTERGNVWLIVRSSNGQLGEGEATFFQGQTDSCKNGVLRTHLSDGAVYRAWWVDPGSGDIIGSFNPAIVKSGSMQVLRVHDLSGSVARQLSGRHSVPKGVRDETDGTATGDPEDEIRRSV